MEGIIAVILFWIWWRREGRAEIEQTQAAKAKLGQLADDSRREDYMRTHR
jgi:hypothetical protein